MAVEILQRARRAGALEIFRGGVGVEMHGKQLALDQIRLHRLAQADRYVGLAHGEVELLVAGDEIDADIGIEVEEFAEPGRAPETPDAALPWSLPKSRRWRTRPRRRPTRSPGRSLRSRTPRASRSSRSVRWPRP